jgi:hypothetical protein
MGQVVVVGWTGFVILVQGKSAGENYRTDMKKKIKDS